MKANQSESQSLPLVVIAVFAIILYLIVFAFAIHNIARYFNQMKSLSLGLFYLTVIFALITRIGFIILSLITIQARIIVFLLILPGTFTLNIAVAQINIYLQLILRVRAVQNNLNVRSVKRKEYLIQILIVIMMMVYPFLIIFEYCRYWPGSAEVYIEWYLRQVWYGIVLVAVGLVITSVIFIRIIPQVFDGQLNDGNEKNNIIITVSLFSFGFLLKLAFCTISNYFITQIKYFDQPLWLYALLAVLFFCVSELLPVLYILKQNHNNFKSDQASQQRITQDLIDFDCYSMLSPQQSQSNRETRERLEYETQLIKQEHDSINQSLSNNFYQIPSLSIKSKTINDSLDAQYSLPAIQSQLLSEFIIKSHGNGIITRKSLAQHAVRNTIKYQSVLLNVEQIDELKHRKRAETAYNGVSNNNNNRFQLNQI